MEKIHNAARKTEKKNHRKSTRILRHLKSVHYFTKIKWAIRLHRQISLEILIKKCWDETLLRSGITGTSDDWLIYLMASVTLR